MHIPIYSGTIRYGIFRTLSNYGIFRILVFLERQHIQNQSYIQNPCVLGTLLYSESEVYSEPCHASAMEWQKQSTAIFIIANYNYFRNISLSHSLLYEINMIFFNTSLILTPEVFILCKKLSGPRRPGVLNFDIPSDTTYSICLQLAECNLLNYPFCPFS